MWRIQSEQVFKLATLILPPAAPHFSQQLCKIEHFRLPDCRIMERREGQEAKSQTDTGCPLPDLWRGAGREV